MPTDPERMDEGITVDGGHGGLGAHVGGAHVGGAISSADVTDAPVWLGATIAETSGWDARAALDRLWSRGTAFLGCEIAIMGGAMSWVSERHLVSAISNSGG